MAISLELTNKWMAGETLEGVVYALNEPVEVLSNIGVSEIGCVVSLVEIEPEPKYAVELGNGTDVYVLQSAIQKTAN